MYFSERKGMEDGDTEACREACRAQVLDWDALLPEMRAQGRYHLETY